MFHVRALVLASVVSVAMGASGISADDKADIEKYRKLPEDAKAILEKADQLELLSVHPERPQEKPKDEFHGWKVLGRTVVKDADTRKAIRAAISKGVAESQGVAGCFNPRHGIRATSGGKTVDLVICFECWWMEVHVGGKWFAVWTSGSPEPTLDKVLRDANVPLAPKPKDE